jgi:3',5'-cyclic-AMP phosphodiesterase
MKKKFLILLVFLLIIFPVCGTAAESAPERPYFGIALIGDPHLPGSELPAKENLLRTIDGWDDIDRVVVLGDICKETGTDAEYAAAKAFFSRLHKPLRPITGNHDFIYEDEMNGQGRKVKASAATRRKKLERFAETFGLTDIYRSERIGNYLLVYLSADDPESGYLTKLSEGQVTWLMKELAAHQNLPTIIFFHAPLDGTLKSYNEYANTPNFVAQPAVKLYDLIRANPQLFLWVAGHLHVPATNESYSSPVNLYDKQVTVIHNTDLERKRPWTNVLYLYPERVVVRTYDHWQKSWRPDLERTIRLPGL